MYSNLQCGWSSDRFRFLAARRRLSSGWFYNYQGLFAAELKNSLKAQCNSLSWVNQTWNLPERPDCFPLLYSWGRICGQVFSVSLFSLEIIIPWLGAEKRAPPRKQWTLDAALREPPVPSAYAVFWYCPKPVIFQELLSSLTLICHMLLNIQINGMIIGLNPEKPYRPDWHYVRFLIL